MKENIVEKRNFCEISSCDKLYLTSNRSLKSYSQFCCILSNSLDSISCPISDMIFLKGQPSMQYLGDDLVREERRRRYNALCDSYYRQQRIERIEREIEMNEFFEQEEMFERADRKRRQEQRIAMEIAEALDDDYDSNAPRNAAQWNRKIRETLEKIREDSVESPFLYSHKRRHVPTYIDFIWAFIWFGFMFGTFGLVVYACHMKVINAVLWIYNGIVYLINVAVSEITDSQARSNDSFINETIIPTAELILT